MTTADLQLHIRPDERRSNAVWPAALAVSLLLNAGMLLLLTYGPTWFDRPPVELAVPVQIAAIQPQPAPQPVPAPVQPVPKPEEQAPPPAPAAPPAPAPAPAQAQQPKQQDQPPVKAVQAQPKPELKPQLKPLPPPPKPNLSKDRVEDKSSTPVSKKSPEEKGEGLRKDKGEVDSSTRSVSDLILTDLSELWSPPPQMRGHDFNISLVIDVLPNGTFGPPFAADGPWTPEAALQDLDKQPPVVREALIAFYRSLRNIQPIKLPPGFGDKGKRSVPVRFKLDEMP